MAETKSSKTEQNSPLRPSINKWHRLQELEDQVRDKTPDQIARDMLAREMMTERERGHRAVDKLTGLYAPFLFEESLEREIEGVLRSRTFMQPTSGLGLVLLDIDDFKVFNKRRGKPIGDKVLSNAGGVVKKTVRKRDLAFREGGEEFAIIMPYDNLLEKPTSQTEPSERIRKAVAKSSTDEGDRVTVSNGTTVYMLGDSPKEMYMRADRARRIAKQLGKNRSVKTYLEKGKLLARDLTYGDLYEVTITEREKDEGKKEEILELAPVAQVA
ncbi:MAG: GGDEF domain-containing protein [Patescibacteria group bacterium]